MVFQFFLYEALMHRCCTTGPAGTFFGFIATSSAAIFILPIAAQIVSDPAYLSTVMTGAQSNSNHTSFWPVFSTIVISLIFYRVTATSAFSTLGIIANDSVNKELRGDHRIRLYFLLPLQLCTAFNYSIPFHNYLFFYHLFDSIWTDFTALRFLEFFLSFDELAVCCCHLQRNSDVLTIENHEIVPAPNLQNRSRSTFFQFSLTSDYYFVWDNLHIYLNCLNQHEDNLVCRM